MSFETTERLKARAAGLSGGFDFLDIDRFIGTKEQIEAHSSRMNLARNLDGSAAGKGFKKTVLHKTLVWV